MTNGPVIEKVPRGGFEVVRSEEGYPLSLLGFLIELGDNGMR